MAELSLPIVWPTFHISLILFDVSPGLLLLHLSSKFLKFLSHATTCHRGLFGSNRNYQKLQASTCFNGPKSQWVEGIWLKAKVEPKWNHISWQMEESLSTFPGWLERPSQWLLSRFNLLQSNRVLYNSIPSLSLTLSLSGVLGAALFHALSIWERAGCRC